MYKFAAYGTAVFGGREMNHAACYINDYPRPQFVRKNWLNLNGIWDFAFDKEDKGESMGWNKGFKKEYDITVPFSYQTKASGINIDEHCDKVWYSKKLSINKVMGNRYIIHFEGSD